MAIGSNEDKSQDIKQVDNGDPVEKKNKVPSNLNKDELTVNDNGGKLKDEKTAEENINEKIIVLIRNTNQTKLLEGVNLLHKVSKNVLSANSFVHCILEKKAFFDSLLILLDLDSRNHSGILSLTLDAICYLCRSERLASELLGYSTFHDKAEKILFKSGVPSLQNIMFRVILNVFGNIPFLEEHKIVHSALIQIMTKRLTTEGIHYKEQSEALDTLLGLCNDPRHVKVLCGCNLIPTKNSNDEKEELVLSTFLTNITAIISMHTDNQKEIDIAYKALSVMQAILSHSSGDIALVKLLNKVYPDLWRALCQVFEVTRSYRTKNRDRDSTRQTSFGRLTLASGSGLSSRDVGVHLPVSQTSTSVFYPTSDSICINLDGKYSLLEEVTVDCIWMLGTIFTVRKKWAVTPDMDKMEFAKDLVAEV